MNTEIPKELNEVPTAVASSDGLEARQRRLTEAVMQAAELLTKAADEAVCAGLRVTLTIGMHQRFPGPSCQAVCVVVENVKRLGTYSPNWGRDNANNQCL